MKRIILSALLLLGGSLVADASNSGPVRNEEDLANAMNELRENYPEHWGALPPKEAKTLRDDVQTKPRDIKQILDFHGQLREVGPG